MILLKEHCKAFSLGDEIRTCTQIGTCKVHPYVIIEEQDWLLKRNESPR